MGGDRPRAPGLQPCRYTCTSPSLPGLQGAASPPVPAQGSSTVLARTQQVCEKSSAYGKGLCDLNPQVVHAPLKSCAFLKYAAQCEMRVPTSEYVQSLRM